MSGSASSPLGQINLRSSPVWSCSHGAKCHFWKGASKNQYCIMTLHWQYSYLLHEGNHITGDKKHTAFLSTPLQCDRLALISCFELNLIELKQVLSQLAWSICIWSCSVVLHLCLNWVQTDWRQLDISIRAKAHRDYQKGPFQSFSSTSPLSSFAYEHSPKYPHKRLMSLCSCILPFIGWETMHQSVRLLSLIHTPHENAVMPQENVYW